MGSGRQDDGGGAKIPRLESQCEVTRFEPSKIGLFFTPQLFSFDQVWFHTTYHTNYMFYRHLDLHNCVTGTDLVINLALRFSYQPA